MAGVRVILGVPLYNRASFLPEAIESILLQTFTDFAVVLVDDGSTDGTAEIARRYCQLDSRVHYVRNPERVGMIDNWRRAFDEAYERFPDAVYFAWVSDHDLWHPRWLKTLVQALDLAPRSVLAYPYNLKIDEAGAFTPRKAWRFDTAGVTNAMTRLVRSCWYMSAGNMVYGLFRIDAMRRAGVFRHILVPDRFLLVELSLYGQFTQVAQVLWYRRTFGKLFSLGRQRASFFPNGRPLYAYVPWWISHGFALAWLLGVRGRGRPMVGRVAGLVYASVYGLVAGALHALQSARQLRRDIQPRLAAWLGRRDRRVVVAGVQRRARRVLAAGPVRLRQAQRAMQRKSLKKTYLRSTRRLKQGAFEAVRRPGLLLVRALRAIPIVRRRIVPSLLNEELAEIPSAPSVSAVKAELERLARTNGPIVVGPWVGEVGFELLYWIPFLNWALPQYGLAGRRLIAVSRGGARPWYRHLTEEYVDVFELFTLDEYRRANEERWDKAGHQKQYRVERMDHDIRDRVMTRLQLPQVELLHPSLMYRLLRHYWFEKASVGLFTRHTETRALIRPGRSAELAGLPAEYVAARFYFRPSFPDTPENRRFAADVIRAISERTPVVLLNTGLRLDDHEDLGLNGTGIHHVDHLMAPERNLEVQTEIIAHASAFVGTYGGLAYLAPFFSRPSISFYSTDAELIPAHLDISWRLARTMKVPVIALPTSAAALIQSVLAHVHHDVATHST